MKIKIVGLIIGLLTVTIPAWAQDDQERANDLILKMQHDLNLSEDQVANITQIVDRYTEESGELEKSIQEGTINSSAVDSQKQQFKDQEEQGIAQYLRPDQLYEWRQMESQMGQEQGQDGGNGSDGSDTGDSDSGQYSNLPNNPS